MNDLESKRKRIETFAKIGAFLVVSFLVGPVILATIQGALGLIVAGVIVTVAVNLAPWFGSMVANWRLKALKYEASKNPIETLQNDYATKRENLIAFKQRIESTVGELTTFRQKLDGFKKDFPADAAKFDEQYQQARKLLDLRKLKYQRGQEDLKRYSAEIDRAKAFWDMAKATAAMNKAAGVDTEEFNAKIQRETALDSVQKSLGMAFAELEVSLMDEDGKTPVQIVPTTVMPAAITNGSETLDLVIDIESAKVHQAS